MRVIVDVRRWFTVVGRRGAIVFTTLRELQFELQLNFNGEAGSNTQGKMVTIEAEFSEELDLLRREGEGAAQMLYGYLAIHDIAAAGKVRQALNKNALFWNTTLGAMQMAVFITLGRIFDQDSPHNVDRLIKLAQKNHELFSKAALAHRKHGNAQSPPAWLDEYLKTAYVATAEDFRALRKHVAKNRKIYEANYRDIRNKYFAHRAVIDPSALFSKTNVRELQRLVVFVMRLYEAIWHLLHNGRKPTLSPARYSLRRIRDRPSPAGRDGGVQERIVREAERVMASIAGNKG